jgi:hypothetical protein
MRGEFRSRAGEASRKAGGGPKHPTTNIQHRTSNGSQRNRGGNSAYGPKARPAVLVLQELLNAANEADRVRVTNALMRIAPEVLPDAIPQEPPGFLPDFLISK